MVFNRKNVINEGVRQFRLKQHCEKCGLPTYSLSGGDISKVDPATGVISPILDDCKCKNCNCLFCKQRRGYIGT